MTGWRIGYAAGPIPIIKAMSKIQGQSTSCANSIGQMAGIAALSGDQSCVIEMRDEFLKRRNMMVRLLNELPGINCDMPGGAFYTFPDFSAYIGRKGNNEILKDTFSISEYILNNMQVVTVPGDGFGAPGHIRFSYAANMEIIKKDNLLNKYRMEPSLLFTLKALSQLKKGGRLIFILPSTILRVSSFSEFRKSIKNKTRRRIAA